MTESQSPTMDLPRGVWEAPHRDADGNRLAIAVTHGGRRIAEHPFHDAYSRAEAVRQCWLVLDVDDSPCGFEVRDAGRAALVAAGGAG